MRGGGRGSFSSGEGLVSCSYEDGNEHFSSIKGGEIVLFGAENLIKLTMFTTTHH